MTFVFPRSPRWALLLCLLTGFSGPSASGQVVTPLGRQLDRIDLAVSGVGEFTGNTSGTNYLNQPLTQKPSTTLGALITIRYVKSPLLGAEFNYGYARYTQNYSQYIIGGAQSKATEYTVGYLAHTPEVLGLKTFAGGGLGVVAFTPTPFGGQGLPEQGRLAFYYTLGVEQSVISPHFGLRAQFRQVFYKSPDFGQNYLTINQRTSTYEPGVGFYLRF